MKDTFIILRTAPDAPNPTSGAIPTISRPTPLEISRAGDRAKNGQLWYLVRNMSNGDTGYVRATTSASFLSPGKQAAVQTPQPTIPPIETPTPEPTAEPTPPPTPEPIPQELTEGVFTTMATTRADRLHSVNRRTKTARKSRGFLPVR